MARVPVKDDLQIDENRRFEKRDWRAQRIGWAVLLILVIATLVGAFGRGPLAHRSKSLAPGTTLDYDAVTRHQSPTLLVINAAPTGADSIVLDVSRRFLDGVTVEAVSPEPERVLTAGDAMRFILARAPGADATIKIEYEPVQNWARHGWIRIDGGAPARFTQFVLP